MLSQECESYNCLFLGFILIQYIQLSSLIVSGLSQLWTSLKLNQKLARWSSTKKDFRLLKEQSPQIVVQHLFGTLQNPSSESWTTEFPLRCTHQWEGVYVQNVLRVSHSVVPDSLRPQGLQPSRLLCPWNFPCKDTGVVCHFLIQCTEYFLLILL